MDRLDLLARMLEDALSGPFAAVWLLGAALAWLFLGARRLRRDGAGPGALLLLGAGVLALAGLVVLGATALRGGSLSAARLAHYVGAVAPHYAGLLAALATLAASRRLERAAPARLAAGLALLLAAAAAVAFLSRRGLEERVIKHVVRDPLEARFAAPPAAAPKTDPRRPGMVQIPAGPFVQGSLSPLQMAKVVGSPEGDERPVRSRHLGAFYLDRTEVTNAAFARFVAETGYLTDPERLATGTRWDADGFHIEAALTWRTPGGPGDSIDGRDAHPVVQVSWNDARAYCAWAGKRLPSEAEWEKAARGPDARVYPWGDGFDPTRLNYCDRACADLPEHRDAAGLDGFARTAPVGSFPAGASPYGALDMAGNVWEWVEDRYDPYYYAVAPPVDPRGPLSGSKRVVRGGSFTSEAGYTRTTSRSYDGPTEAFFGVGFRCAQDP